MTGRCRSVYPSSLVASHEGAGWSGPLRCVLSPHEHDLHLNSGIAWRTQPTGRNLDGGPCPRRECFYGTCSAPLVHGCGGCCRCLGGCLTAYEGREVRHQYRVSSRAHVLWLLDRDAALTR